MSSSLDNNESLLSISKQVFELPEKGAITQASPGQIVFFEAAGMLLFVGPLLMVKD
jgi:hypothetical protein